MLFYTTPTMEKRRKVNSIFQHRRQAHNRNNNSQSFFFSFASFGPNTSHHRSGANDVKRKIIEWGKQTNEIRDREYTQTPPESAIENCGRTENNNKCLHPLFGERRNFAILGANKQSPISITTYRKFKNPMRNDSQMAKGTAHETSARDKIKKYTKSPAKLTLEIKLYFCTHKRKICLCTRTVNLQPAHHVKYNNLKNDILLLWNVTDYRWLPWNDESVSSDAAETNVRFLLCSHPCRKAIKNAIENEQMKFDSQLSQFRFE